MEDIELYLNRFDKNSDGVTGLFYIDGKAVGFTVERPWLDNKRSISCIPEYRYEVVLNENPTDLTMHYRNKYDWFVWHLMLKDVPDRSGIYIHVANKPGDVEGCVGVATTHNGIGSNFVGASTPMYKKIYLKLLSKLQAGGKVFITIDSKIIK